MDYAAIYNADARLRILQMLAKEADASLSAALISRYLEAYGIKRSREWVNSQLRALEELGAVTIASMDEALIARLARDGRDHVERRRLLDGVARPDDDAA